jgi:hypothetical protein
MFSIAYADADGWRCFYPLTRGHLTAAEARALMRRERGHPLETPAEADEAETLLAFGQLWTAITGQTHDTDAASQKTGR